MTFYEIDIRSQPVIVFACSTNNVMTENSQNIIDHRKGMLELSVCSTVDMHYACDYGSYQETITPPKGSVVLFMPDCHYRIRPALPSPHVQITTVAVKIDQFHFTRHHWDPDSIDEHSRQTMLEILSHNTLLLPQNYHTDTEGEQLILSLLKSLIGRYPDKRAAGQYTCLSRWYEICAMLDTGFRTTLSQVLSLPDTMESDYSSHYYVYKIKTYIRAHLHEDIHMHDLAALLQLSPDYVGKLFREDTGYSVSDYIARQRVQALSEQIGLYPDEYLSVLALRCGFRDIRYAQRLFRKYSGVSMSEYRRLGRGVTLYHENPWQENSLDGDIFTGTWEGNME